MPEPTSEPAIPTNVPTSGRRRLAKRLVLVMCVLGFLYGAARWLSIRSDQRLVGRWEFTEKGPWAEHKGWHLLPASKIQFDPYGDVLVALGRFPPPRHGIWNIENNKLVIAKADRPFWHKWYVKAAKFFLYRRDIPEPPGPRSNSLLI